MVDVVSWNFSGRASFWAHIPPSQPKKSKNLKLVKKTENVLNLMPNYIECILAVVDVVSWNFSGRASFWAHIPQSQPKNVKHLKPVIKN